ncbi:MAG: dihydrolipoamide acetyltransferase family protein [Thermoanaerobaculales bacterium]|jgi:pyruvate dehydrogenase E2 component (dihydrolipoamide acetyltransferase)|nr:dihydrolipoamide acetyltransferase family protein [Thermoanaerobaculales bacterium]
MAFVFKFPDVGEGIHEGRVVEWLVAEGSEVAEDQPLLKVETDKAVVELPSPRAGTVLSLHAADDAAIEVGDPLVTIGDAGESVPDETAPKAATPPVEQVPAPEPEAPVVTKTRRPLATPRTRALARRLGVDLASVKGSGNGGRITDDDIERAASAPSGAAASSLPPAPAATGVRVDTVDGEIERVSVTHLRKVIAGAMRTSKQVSAHVTHVEEADVTELFEHYRTVKTQVEADGGRFTLLPFFVKALVAVLKDHPIFNASVDEEAEEILLKRFYNIGIAVDTPEGLIVPVLKNADGKDMLSLAAEIADLAERARERRLGLAEMRGGTCTLTNIGPLGGVFATPIINQPELAIVGLHKIQDKPVVVDGEIVVRKMMYLSVSFDHRWIDGAQGARFMTDLVRLISNPGLLMARL